MVFVPKYPQGESWIMNELEFGGRSQKPDIRWLHDIREVVYDQLWLSTADDRELYYMYRDLYLSRSDRDMLVENDLRYDITIIPPGRMGKEFVKTAGHYHPPACGSDITYPEIYEVLEGEALYLLQKEDASDTAAVVAAAGDKVIIPPGYGHITINRSLHVLKMANFVSRSFSSIYEPIRNMGGAAYFFTEEGFIKNPRYASAGDLRRVAPPSEGQLKALGMTKKREMYPLLRTPERMSFLRRPQDHAEAFVGLLED
ncbi:MAG: Glucose-6-phosphate isomerase [Methanosaeta sp. PtaU1.Bin028]|nr:MAG: Glucose-6-phosphate isomerase [Methanosaeta sp. PtaU1.Bin028]